MGRCACQARCSTTRVAHEVEAVEPDLVCTTQDSGDLEIEGKARRGSIGTVDLELLRHGVDLITKFSQQRLVCQ